MEKRSVSLEGRVLFVGPDLRFVAGAGRMNVNPMFHTYLQSWWQRERHSAPSSTGTLTDLRYERLETTL